MVKKKRQKLAIMKTRVVNIRNIRRELGTFKSKMHLLKKENPEAKELIDKMLIEGSSIRTTLEEVSRKFPEVHLPCRQSIANYRRRYLIEENPKGAASMIGDVATKKILEKAERIARRIQKRIYGEFNPIYLQVENVRRMVNYIKRQFKTKYAKMELPNKSLVDMCVLLGTEIERLERMAQASGFSDKVENVLKIKLDRNNGSVGFNEQNKEQVGYTEGDTERYMQIAKRIKRLFSGDYVLVSSEPDKSN